MKRKNIAPLHQRHQEGIESNTVNMNPPTTGSSPVFAEHSPSDHLSVHTLSTGNSVPIRHPTRLQDHMKFHEVALRSLGKNACASAEVLGGVCSYFPFTGTMPVKCLGCRAEPLSIIGRIRMTCTCPPRCSTAPAASASWICSPNLSLAMEQSHSMLWSISANQCHWQDRSCIAIRLCCRFSNRAPSWPRSNVLLSLAQVP